MAAAGYRILRFPNEAVRDNLPAVLAATGAAADREPRRPASPGRAPALGDAASSPFPCAQGEESR